MTLFTVHCSFETSLLLLDCWFSNRKKPAKITTRKPSIEVILTRLHSSTMNLTNNKNQPIMRTIAKKNTNRPVIVISDLEGDLDIQTCHGQGEGE